MNCNDAEKFILLYVDNQLIGKKKQKIEKHISTCENCRNELAAATGITKKYADLPDREIIEDLKHKIFENIKSLPIEQPFSIKNSLKKLKRQIKTRLDFIPKFKPSIKFAFTTALIFIFVLVGINHYRKNYQQKQNELLKIFDRTPFLERTYDLSLEAQGLKLEYKMNNNVDDLQKKIEKLKIKRKAFLDFSAFDVEVNQIKKTINQIKNENVLRRNSS